jgi:ABC-type Fe3+ transport system permease subunit
MTKRWGFSFLVALFIAPYFFALIISKFQMRLPSNFLPLILSSFAQAAGSAFGALVLGCIGAVGLIGRSRRWEMVALSPVATPAIAIVLGFMTLFPQWRGLSAVIAAHTLSSAGLIAVVLARQIRSVLGGSVELAWVEGASRGAIWIRGVFPALKSDIVRLGLSVFAASLASFSIPLLLAGSDLVAVEIASHHAIRFENAWDIAAALSLFQWSMLLVLVFILRSPADVGLKSDSESRGEIGRILGRGLGVNTSVVAVLIAPLMIVFSLLHAPKQGLAQLESANLFERSAPILLALQGSLATATLAGVFSAVLLIAFAAATPSRRQRIWLSGYVAPSVAITGFATLVIGWGQDPSFALDSLRIAVGAALLLTPVIWRLRWELALARLERQLKVAETLGAPNAMIFWRVLLPQLRELLFWSGGLISFWVWGDYALGSISASRSMTLGMLAKGLLESYRVEAASLVVLACLIFGAMSYCVFQFGGVARVES